VRGSVETAERLTYVSGVFAPGFWEFGGVGMARHVLWAAVSSAGLLAASCGLPLDPPVEVIQARFDPNAGVIPTPNDLLRNEDEGHLELPIADELGPAERSFREWFNTKDGWSTTQPAQVEFTAPIEASSIDEETVQVWLWGETPVRMEGLTRALDESGTELSIDPPEEGWERGRQYVVVVAGREGGVRGEEREEVECDATFYFLRQTERLDVREHQRAFPGATRAERMENGARLEEIRSSLAPKFSFFESRGLPRARVAALWTFTATVQTELAMDRASQRMPLPFDLLIDPNTNRIDLPAHHSDSPVVLEAKVRLREFDGWALSASLMFETSGEVDPATVSTGNIELWQLGATPRRLPADVNLFSDRRHIGLTPRELLTEATSYGIVVREGLRDEMGLPVEPMVIGHLMRMEEEISIDGSSQLSILSDEDAARVEGVRQRIAPLLDQIGRDGVITAWPFTTQTVIPRIRAAIDRAAALGSPAVPTDLVRRSPLQALGDFPLGIASLLFVGEVVEGTLSLPSWLDPRSRAWRPDDQHEFRDVRFTMTVPRNPEGPLRAVIFGHGIMTERRFILALGDAFAQRGFVSIAIDLPFHGLQTYCISGGPISVPDPQTGEVTSLPPCASGTHCDDYGRCVDDGGAGNELTRWPVLNYPIASGAAFIEVDHLPSTRDHFLQAVIDLSELSRSLRGADWEEAVGAPLMQDSVYYAGQSLGGILGATFVSMSPDVERAVLNVPGADVVDMFRDSPFFAAQIRAAFTRLGVEEGTWEAERFLNIARIFMDAVDPQSVAQLMRGRDVMIQMALLDMIIPNAYTETLARISGAPKRDYVAEHAFIVIPVEPAYLRGSIEMADFLAERFTP
jgi:pimeloyl-ACP methyl ester carboxylesterase